MAIPRRAPAARGRRGARRHRLRPASTPPVLQNRRSWEATSVEYERRHASDLAVAGGAAWGLWRIPESRLRLLGAVTGRRILELGCGAGRWSEALARRGATVVGLDQSRTQLAHLLRRRRRLPRGLSVVLADAENLPLGNRTMDVVFCDWGAMTFADPAATVPEVARVLRPQGLFVFSTSTALRLIAEDRRTGRLGARLGRSYFGLGRVRSGREVQFSLPYGGWIRLFRDHGLRVEGLLETRPPRGARSGYLGRSEERWARRWPVEAIWSLRRDGDRTARPGPAPPARRRSAPR